MANTIKIKRGSGAPSSLAEGELGFDMSNGRLYGGDGSNVINLGFKAILDYVYPVGAIYMSTGSTSPASIFGGTWEQVTDKFLLAAGSSYTAGSTGGAATVTLTTSQIPSHNHSGSSASAGAHTHTATTGSSGSHTHTGTTNSDGAHNHNGNDIMYYWHTNGASNPWMAGFGSGKYAGYTQYITSNGSAHSHAFTTASSGAHTHSLTTASSGSHTHTITVGSTGGGGAHSNMPPYLAVYIWKRTA